MRPLKSQNIDGIPLFAGVGSMLQALSQAGVIMAMVSSDSESNVRRALGDHAALMSQFACGASTFGKAAKFRKVLKRTDIAADDAIAIGIDPHDPAVGPGPAWDWVCWRRGNRGRPRSTSAD